jgi:PAS domain S-box-containing protein
MAPARTPVRYDAEQFSKFARNPSFMANPSSPHDPDDFRLVVDSIPGLVFTLGVKGELEFANRQMLDYLGVTREELSTWPPPAFIHLADLGRVGELCDESLTTGVAHECELRLRGADAVYRWFQLRCSPGAKSDGRVVHWYGCLSEIDGLQQAKIASREELRSLEILIDSIPGLVFTTPRMASWSGPIGRYRRTSVVLLRNFSDGR